MKDGLLRLSFYCSPVTDEFGIHHRIDLELME